MEPSDSLQDVRALIAFLRRPTLRTRVGVWHMPLECVGQERDVAARLGVEAVDVREAIWQQLPEGTRFVRLTVEKTLAALDVIATTQGNTDCAFVYNMDLLLTGLSRENRQRIWENLFDGLPHRSRALLMAIPETAHSALLPARWREVWRRDGRLVWQHQRE